MWCVCGGLVWSGWGESFLRVISNYFLPALSAEFQEFSGTEKKPQFSLLTTPRVSNCFIMTYQGHYSSSLGLGNWPSTTGYSTTTPVVLMCDKCGVQSCNTKGTSFEICNSCDIKLCRDCGPLPNECSTTCVTGGCNSTLCGKEYGGSNFQMVRRQVPKCQDCNNNVLYCQRCRIQSRHATFVIFHPTNLDINFPPNLGVAHTLVHIVILQ